MKLRGLALSSLLMLALAPLATSASTVGHARGGSSVADGKAKATRATVTARRDALAKVAGELRAFATQPAPKDLNPKEQKADAEARIADTSTGDAARDVAERDLERVEAFLKIAA